MDDQTSLIVFYHISDRKKHVYLKFVILKSCFTSVETFEKLEQQKPFSVFLRRLIVTVVTVDGDHDIHEMFSGP